MRGPFLVHYGKVLNEPALYDLVTFEFEFVEEKCRDRRIGLLYHGWDESRTQLWANPKTGCSPHFWARGMGWFMMALVDVLDVLPETHRGWKSLQDILKRTAESILLFQDQETGLWYQIMDQKERDGNYRKSSASAMFIYALAKGVRKGYLPISILPTIDKAFGRLSRNKGLEYQFWVVISIWLTRILTFGGRVFNNSRTIYQLPRSLGPQGLVRKRAQFGRTMGRILLIRAERPLKSFIIPWNNSFPSRKPPIPLSASRE